MDKVGKEKDEVLNSKEQLHITIFQSCGTGGSQVWKTVLCLGTYCTFNRLTTHKEIRAFGGKSLSRFFDSLSI